MSRRSLTRRVAGLAIWPLAALTLVLSGAVPARATVDNSILGGLDPSAPGANPYSGCVAAILTGDGFVFGSGSALGAELASLWPSLPAGVTSACHQAVLTRQPQVCVNPPDPALCPAAGAEATSQLAGQATALSGTWQLIPDPACCSGAAQSPLDPAAPPKTPMATVTGTFTTPTAFCDSPGSCPPGTVGLWTNCGNFSCGQVTHMSVALTGRTPDTAAMPTGESAVLAHVYATDGHGRVVADLVDTYGNNSSGTGCGGPEPHQCNFGFGFGWDCTDSVGAVANCASQSLTVSITFLTGWAGQPAPPTLAEQVQMSLSAQLLDWHGNPACPDLADCLPFDDPRLAYGGPDGRPTVVDYGAAPLPAAVINLDPSNLGCLVGVSVLRQPAATCLDLTGAQAPIVQAAHAPVTPALPPAVTATAVPAAGAGVWDNQPVSVTIVATDQGSGVASVSYRADGAQVITATIVPGTQAVVTLAAEGVTTLSYWATDKLGDASQPQTLTVQLDLSPPSFGCAAPDGLWHAADVALACSAIDAFSGLADPSAAAFQLRTSVAAGTETASAATGSRQLCDLAGNCTTAGPISDNQVDRKAPDITLSAPAGAYTVGQLVSADYACSDGGSGVATCAGGVPAGSAVDTSQPGSFAFAVSSTDNAGNQSARSSSYTVGYAICPSGMQPGSALVIVWRTFTVCDAAGGNLSGNSLSVHATGILQQSTGAVLPFRGVLLFIGDRYLLVAWVGGLPDGDYQVLVSVGSDPTSHSLPFTLSGLQSELDGRFGSGLRDN
ncbi:MAG: hypothetical protein E6I85_05930 [Chloroflexi bacterium]|nr:MAG: hypothetical protein E6I85_05930 [Chloroflexota bacterium]